MSNSNSSLVVYTKLSPNKSVPRNKPITKITPHHVAGVLTIETLAGIFVPTSRQASCNYGIGNDGRIGLIVEEKDRAWTSSSAANDNQAITFEVSNSASGDASGWPIGEKAWNAMIDLMVDCCKRNPGITQKDGKSGLWFDGTPNGSLTFHHMFAATSCPGPYIKARAQQICDEVNKRLNPVIVTPPIAPSQTGTGDKPSDWAKEATTWAKSVGLFAGDGNGNYDWQLPMTREMTAVVLQNFQNIIKK